jgi:hypothetical protein
MLQIGHYINPVSLTIATLHLLIMQLSLLDIKLMMFGLLEILGELLGDNLDILDLLLEIPVDYKLMLLSLILLDLTTLSTFI